MSDSFTDIFGGSVKNMMSEIHTAVPAEVVSFDAQKRKVSVRPTVREKSAKGFVESPTVHEVPVQYPASSNAGVTFPLSKGDTGILIFSQADIEAWCQRGGLQNPSSERKWDLTDAMFIPGLFAFSESDPEVESNKLVVRYGNAKIKIGTKVTIEAGGQSMAGLIGDLFTALSSAATTGSPCAQVLNPATITQLNALKAQFALLLEG